MFPKTEMGKTAAILTLLAILISVISNLEEKGFFIWSLTMSRIIVILTIVIQAVAGILALFSWLEHDRSLTNIVAMLLGGLAILFGLLIAMLSNTFSSMGCN